MSMISFIKRKPLLVFFILAYIFAWVFTPLIVISPVYGLPGLFAPAFAALIVSGITGGRHEVIGLLRKLTIWRVNLIWYLVALGLPVVVSLFIALLGRFFGSDPSLQFAPITALGLVVFILVIGEELGWRGYAQIQFEKKYPTFVAAIILGILWGFWHLPNFFIPGLPHYEVPLLAFIFYTTSLSILAAWLMKNTRGSVLIATLFHGATNTFGFLTPGLEVETRWWLIAIVYTAAALVIILGTRVRLQRSLRRSTDNASVG